MTKTALLTIVLIIVVVAGGAYALFGRSNSDDAKDNATNTSSTTNTAPSTQTDPNSTEPTATQTGDTTAAGNTITYSNNGFSPASLTVKAGSQVTVKNDSSKTLQFDSDPHPQHTDDPELNIGIIKAGESKTITVTTTGSHGYHNHLNDDTGTLIVQ